MGVISLLSCSGAPGVTTISLATSAALTTTAAPEPVMIEMALSGGVVAAQYDLPLEPGLASLAIAVGGESPDILSHAQELPGGLPVVVAPPSNSKTVRLVEARADPLADYLFDTPETVVVDCGRIGITTPLRPILEASTLVAVVVRPSRENFQLAATTITELNEQLARPLPVGWVVVGSCPWSQDEIVSEYGLPVLSMIADDRTGAEAVAGLRKLRRRSPLARSVQSFADDIAKHLRIATPAEPMAYLQDADHHHPTDDQYVADDQYVTDDQYVVDDQYVTDDQYEVDGPHPAPDRHVEDEYLDQPHYDDDYREEIDHQQVTAEQQVSQPQDGSDDHDQHRDPDQPDDQYRWPQAPAPPAAPLPPLTSRSGAASQ